MNEPQMRVRFVRWLFCFCIFATGSAVAQQRPPNVVLLVADDLGYGELGCQGNSEIPTPHIDSIAAEGIRFTQGYVTAPFCSASRAGFLTGRYQARFGYDFNPIGARNEEPGAGLPATEKTIAQLLHDVGYATALIGKWHLGGTAAYHPLRRGFDEFFGFTHEGHYFVPPPYDGATTMLRRRSLPGGSRGRWQSSDGTLVLSTHMGYDEPAYDANNPIVRNSQPVVENEYLTDALTREAVRFIRRNQARPFFLYLAYNAVHSPLQAQTRYMDRFRRIDDIHRRIFAAMLANLDDSVGTVLEELEGARLLENTLVVFFSDNGGPTRELTSSNRPLRGEKGNLYEGGIRVPMLCQWTGRLPAGFVYDRPVTSLDMSATAVTAGGGKPAEDQPLDGVDLLPFLEGTVQNRPHERMFWRVGRRAALRLGDWKAVRNTRSEAGPWELYNVSQDISEASDLARDRPAKLEELRAAWESINAEMAEPIRW